MRDQRVPADRVVRYMINGPEAQGRRRGARARGDRPLAIQHDRGTATSDMDPPVGDSAPFLSLVVEALESPVRLRGPG